MIESTSRSFKKIKIACSFLVLFISSYAFATPYHQIGFWKNPVPTVPHLSYTTNAPTGLATWTCTAVTVETRNGANVATAVGSNTTVNLTGGTGIHFFSDSGCTTEVTSVVISTGTSSATFYFQSGKQTAGSNLVSAATGYVSATQAYSVTSYLGCTWLGTTTAYNTASNWSCGHVPTTTAGDIAVFDTNCTNCSPAATTSTQTPYGLWLTRDYTGTVTYTSTATTSTTVQSGGGCKVDAGTLALGSRPFTCSGLFTQRGGTVTAGSGTITMSSGMAIYAGTFTMNAATTNTLSTSTAAGLTLAGGTFNGGGGAISIGGVTSVVTISGGTFVGGAGDFTFAGNFGVAGGTFTSPTGSLIGSATNKTLLVTSGTFNQAGIINLSGTFTINSGGTFVGGSQAMTVKDLNITGGTITATSGTTSVTGNMNLSGFPTFNHHNGTLAFIDGASTTRTVDLGSASLYNLTFNVYGSNFTITGTPTANDVSIAATNTGSGWGLYTMNGGTINVGGNLTSTGSGFSGSTVFKLTGNAAGQTVTSSTAVFAVGSPFPSLQIAAGANPVTFSNNIAIAGSYSVNSVGTFNNTNTDMYIYASGTATLYPGNYNYKNVTLNCYSTTYDMASGTLIVTGTLALKNADSYPGNDAIISGFINAYGNVTVDGYGYGYLSTAILTLAGNASGQSITGTGGGLPPLIVAAGANPVTFSGSFTVNGNYTYTSSGAFTSTGSTVSFVATSADSTIKPGTVHYNNVTLTTFSKNMVFNSETFYIDGNLSAGTANYWGYTLNSGTLAVKGNVTFVNYGFTGTVLVKMVGNAAGQTLSSSGTSPQIPNFEIAAGANNVTFTGTNSFSGNYTVTSVGTLTTSGSTVNFSGGGGGSTVTISPGTESYNDVTFNGDASNFDLNAKTLKVGGNLTVSDSNYYGYNIDNGLIELTGNLTASGYGKAGSVRMKWVGTNSSFNRTGTGAVPNGDVEVAISGTLTLNSGYFLNIVGQDLTVTSGAINMNNHDMTIRQTLTLAPGTSITRGTGVLTVNSVVIGAGAYSSGTIF